MTIPELSTNFKSSNPPRTSYGNPCSLLSFSTSARCSPSSVISGLLAASHPAGLAGRSLVGQSVLRRTVRPAEWDKLVFGFPRTLMRGFALPPARPFPLSNHHHPHHLDDHAMQVKAEVRALWMPSFLPSSESDLVSRSFLLPLALLMFAGGAAATTFLSPERSSTADKIRSPLMDLSNIGGGEDGRDGRGRGRSGVGCEFALPPRTSFSPAALARSRRGFSRRNRRVITKPLTRPTNASAVH